ncbi:MAG: autotransporter-associated beta strand repeat-containing protein [Verrucomicrobiaceae bacterium]|nr:autotransporter-associated beta strand repeat-containing protein [Verrucomicrobiaceae bacterium]
MPPPTPKATLSLACPRPILLAVVLACMACATMVEATDYTWTNSSGGNWNASTNWSPNTAFPNATVDKATFGSAATSKTISVSAAVTVNQVIGTVGYTLRMNGNSLTFDGTAPLLRHTVSSSGDRLNITRTTGGSLILATDTTFDVVGTNADIFVEFGISGAGGLIKTGTGDLRLRGTQSYQGATTISGGRILVGYLFTDPQSGAVTINDGALNPAAAIVNNGTLEFTGSSRTQGTHFGTLSGTGNLVFNNDATLNAANTHSGSTFINSGTLALANVNALQNSTLSINSSSSREVTFTVAGTNTYHIGAITGTDALAIGGNTLSIGGNNTSTTYAGDISGSAGGLTKTGTGTFTLSVGNTYTGTTTVSQGILQVNANNALGTAAAGTSVASGAALKLNGVAYTTAEALSLNGSGISGDGALVNTGTSSYAGQITAATNATISAGGGTLTLTGGLVKNGTTLTIAGGGSVIVSGTGISGASANSDLVVDGTTLVVNAASNYNGPTTVQNSGNLVANAAITTTQLTVSTNSTLSGTGSIQNGSDTLYLNGALIVGDTTLGSPVASDLEISGTGTTMLGTASQLHFDLFTRGGDLTADPTSIDRLRLFGPLDATLGGTLLLANPTALTGFALGDQWHVFDLQSGSSITGTLTINDNALNLAPGLGAVLDPMTGILSILSVPEPSRAILIMFALSATVLRRRR